MPLPFNKNLDLKLLKLVKENPILYNTKHAKYLDFDSREVVWQKIGDSLSRPAVNFAGIQCQAQLGDYDEKKHKPGFIEKLEEYIPEQYCNAWGIEKKILKEYATHKGSSELEAKFLYIKTARALPTYGVTFFLVKERQKDKKKLVPRLLGINAEAILRLDEVTKEILQQWPLTHVKTYHAGKSQTFTLNFGDYSDKEYCVKTQDCHRIKDILQGYIDIISRRMRAKPYADSGESMAICHDNIQQGQSHMIQHVSNSATKMVTESFVGPTKLVPHDQASSAQSGTMITTVQQIIVTDHLRNQQQALKGEMPLRGDMSKDCIQKLNGLNTKSVKIVGLLTDPTEAHIAQAQQIVWTMQEDFPIVEQGVKETADKQAIDDAKKMLLDELQDLNNYLNKLTGSLEPGKLDTNDAKDAAESIADLTTQMYFSIDPKTRRRSELLRRSRKSFRAGEKTEQTLRRASFIAAATTALHAVDNAQDALNADYTGPKLSEEEQKKLEKALEDKLSKLNAAIALYLMAHSDPDNIDYSAAINSMNDINELMPELAKDGQKLASSLEPAARKQLQEDMRSLLDATKKVCGMSGNHDHEKMQEASNQYADVAGRLLYKFSRGNNADKENEIIQLAKEVGDKVSRLHVATNELTCQAQGLPATADVEEAGLRTVSAAKDLLYSAQLTAPAIHEPHCQSALTAAAAGLSSAVHRLQASWRPLVEDHTRQHMQQLLHTRANDVAKALDRLRDAYGNLEGDEDVVMLPQTEKKRLKFIHTLSGAKNRLQGVKFDEWNKLPPSGSVAPSEEEKAAALRKLEQELSQINAAVAALATATADRNNPDYDTAELALSTITELMPRIAKDMEIASSDKDEATRDAMRNNLCAMCDAAQEICEGDGYQHAQGEPLSKFANASSKLVFLVSPSADKGRQKHILDLSSTAHQQASQLVSEANKVKEQVPPAAAAELGNHADQTLDDAQALHSVAQVTAASIESPRCRDALSSAVSRLQGSADSLNSSCQQQAPQRCAAVRDQHSKLTDSLGQLAAVCEMADGDAVSSPAQLEKQRLQFVRSMSGAKRRLDAAAQQLTKPMACQLMTEDHAALLEKQLSDRLAQLNAAVAALAAATADREHPNYAAAEQAIKDITTLMPHVVQDTRKLCGTKTAAGQSAMLQDIRALCDASKELCDSAGQPQGLADAAARFTAASRNLQFYASPGDDDKENEVVGLSVAACSAASQLLSQVQHLTQVLQDSEAAGELDARGARAADAAQALLTIAQATGPTIAHPECQKQLISAAEKLRGTASELTSAAAPHLTHKPDMKQQVTSSHRQLEDSLDKLIEVCKAAGGTQSTISPAEKEKRRLKFINSLSGAKNRLYDSEQQLKQPLTRQSLTPEEAAALERKLSDRMAQLNAAIAALAAARSDPENPDYAASEKAVKDISELMPLIVQDSRKLSSIKDQHSQSAMLEDLKALCQASRTICENTETNPKVDTTAFNKAASKLVFLVSPAADKAKEKQVLDLSKAACKDASDYVSQVQSIWKELGPAIAAQLEPAGARVQHAADALHAVTQATSPSISQPSCSAAVVLSAEKLRGTASELTSAAAPHLTHKPDMKQQVTSSHSQLEDSLDKLVQACKAAQSEGTPSAQQEKQRLKFISSVSGLKNHFDVAEKQLKEPLICQMMREEDGAAMERKLSDRLAQLNAALAALAAATADRERPDYTAAERAVKTITELMPQLVKESHTLCGTKSGEQQAVMLQELRALCEASREICDNAGQAQGLSDAAAKFSAASGKLVSIVGPKGQTAHEQQVTSLSVASCGKTSELLSQVQRLTEMIPDAAQAAELDNRGARAADAAQGLLTAALATAPTISDPRCQKQLISAAEKLRGTASELTSAAAPHLTHKPDMKQQVTSSHSQLEDSLDKLVQACKAAQSEGTPSAQQEKQRLKFISSVSGLKNHFDVAEKQLKEPLICQMMREEDGAAMERKLSDRLAQLNAALAALAAATADRERPDYTAAERAVKTISELMPQLVKESHTLCGTKSGEQQAVMLQELRALCEASREICDNAGQAQGLSDAAAKFSAASGKLVSIVGPKGQSAHEQQVTSLSVASCGKTSELLSQVQRLTEMIPDAAQAAELDNRGARAADAAQGLLTVALATAPTISDPRCQKELISAAEKLRGTASELTSAAAPHLTHKPDMKQQVTSSHRQLEDSLDKLVQACKAAQSEGTPSAQQEKQRLKFISSVSGLKNHFDVAEKQLKEPLQTQITQQEPAVLQRRLSDRLAQLNAAVAALAVATADREHSDYEAAHRAVETIPELLRGVIHDSQALSVTKDGPAAAAITEDLRALCEATRQICENAGQQQGLGEAATKFCTASSKIKAVAGTKTHSAHEKQVLDLSAASCGKTSELLSQVQRLTEMIPDAAVAVQLDQRGARAVDAAQVLLTVAEMTAPSISEPASADLLVSVAEKLRSTASDLTSSCQPHLGNKPDMKQQVTSSHSQLKDSLDKLIQACKAAKQSSQVSLSPQQEKQRIEFVSSMSGAKQHLETAEQQIKKPLVSQQLKQADSAALQHQLARRLAQLNAAVAALTAATQDGKNPDYPAAERAVTTIIELMPQVVQDSHTLCGTQHEAGQAAMLQHLRQLCDASRDICDSAGQAQKLNEASAKLAHASGNLMYIVSSEGSQGTKPAPPSRRPPPPVPSRDPRHSLLSVHSSSAHTDATKDFLDTLRGEESHVGVDAKRLQAIEDEKKAYKQFCEMMDSAEKGLKTAETGLKELHSTASPVGVVLPAVEVARREQHMEDSLARAGVHVAALVAANYNDKLDYKAAMEPTIALTESVKNVVNDGSAIYSALPEQSRKSFVEDMSGLCRATHSICDAAKSKEDVKKLNDAAISFGNQSVKLLRVVSSNIEPDLEKQVISRAKAIGDTASRLALEASDVASAARDSEPAQEHVQHICTAGAGTVDAAGKLVYTAKLIAPTIHHATCQDALVSSADNLSSSLTNFSKTWAPLASSQQPSVHKLTQEAAHLEDLVERLRKDVKSGKLGKRRERETVVNLDSPLRRMTVQIIDTAKSMAEYGEMSAELKKEYTEYSGRLEEAIRAVDLANARSQRAPQDRNKRDELDIATQDLQVTLLQTRPSRAGQEQNNIVDFRDFLQDLLKEAWELKSAAKKNAGPAGKRTTDDITLLSSKIHEDASRLLKPSDNFDGVTVMESVDDIMDIDMFGQECEVLVKEINSSIQGIHDKKAKQALRAKALPLTESCHLLRFATNSHIMATKSLAYEEALRSLEDVKTSVMPSLAKEAVRKTQKEKKVQYTALGSGACCRRASSSLLQARQRALLLDPAPLARAVTYLATAAVQQPHLLMEEADPELVEVVELPHVVKEDKHLENLNNIVDWTRDITMACQGCDQTVSLCEESTDTQAMNMFKKLHDLDYMICSRNIKTPVLNSEDIDKLLMCKRQPVEGTPKQLEDKLHQLSTKLSSMSSTVVMSVKQPQSLARSLHAAAEAASQLANTARALKDTKRPVQCKKIEEAAHEMCFTTYSLLKTSELVCQDPNHHDARRKLLDACRHLNDSINKLVRSVKPTSRVNQECGEVQRSLQLQRSLLQATPQPCGALPYVHCVDTLQSQRDVLQKLNSDQAMSREEFLKSLNFVASAVSNSTECAAQAAYLLAISEKDESIGKKGIVDVGKLQKEVAAIDDTCVSIIMANHEEQVQEETRDLKVQVQELLKDMDDSIEKTKEGKLKEMLKTCRNEVEKSSKALFSGVQRNPNDKQGTISKVMDLLEDMNDVSNLVEHPELVPTAGQLSADTQHHIDEVMKSSLALITNTEELIKQVKAAPDEPEVMKWVMFNKRKDVLDAFENLLKNVKTSGQRVKLIEGSTDDSEDEKKSYVQKQFDAASKWLLKPSSKAEVKTNGQQAVRNLIDVANKVTEDLKGSDKEDMRNLVMETEQLLTECSKKYDQEQYSVLMERVRELKKSIERGVVTRVVEDFIDAEAPLADLELVDYEPDESKRKFLLEKKIAELLAQLSRVTKTARLIADTDKDADTTVSTQLNSCSEQAELLAPMLVKAAQQRVAMPDDKAVIENYKALLARYAESLSKIRDLCDQSVDPMDFVQTAGETMERMREESTKHNDPMKCAHTSSAITKLANRVIHVSMSSSTARSDPELQKALVDAQAQLAAATPAADTRASRMPDWKDHTAKILQATEQVESLLGGENVFKIQPGPNQPIYNEALNLHVAIRDWSSRDNDIVAVAKRMAVLMAKLSNFMANDKQREVLATSKSIVSESHEVARLAKKLAHECTDHRIKTNLLQTCERIPTISGQLKMLTTVKGFSLGRHGTEEDIQAMDMLVGNAQSLMLSIQDVVKGAASASVKIMSQRGLKMKWVRKNVY